MLNGRPAPPSGELTLDARLCAELGAELTKARDARGLTTAQVAERLLLSTRQVRALEAVDFTAFHNATFHLGALRKYVTFVELDHGLLNKIAAGLVKPDPHAVMLVPSESSDDAAEAQSGPMLSIVGTLVAVAVLAAGGYYLATSRARATATVAPVAAAPVAVPAPVAAPPVPVPVAAPVVEPSVVPAADVPPPQPIVASTPPPAPDGSGFGVIRVLRPTWIFLRDTDNVVTERSLAQGESFVLETQPTYLAVGTADAELSIGSRKVDVAKFVSSGQIRIRAGDFDVLVQGASPIQAPTPAVRR